MRNNIEEQIQDEIRRRVLIAEEQKSAELDEQASQEALAEVTSLPPAEIEQISRRVREEFIAKQAASQKLIRTASIGAVVVAIIMALLTMSQYNTMVNLAEEMHKKWGQVENVYQRRLDLIPNLIRTVQAYAPAEQVVFDQVTTAQTSAGSVLGNPAESLDDPSGFQKFQQAQSDLSNALGGLMAIVDQNPNLSGDQNFLAMQAQLEGSENRIAVERKRFNEAVQAYNAYIKRLPQAIPAMIFGFAEKPYFKAERGAEKAPAITLN